MPNKGIQNVIEVLDFGLSAKQVAQDIFKDGKFHFENLGELVPLYPKALAAYADAGEIIPELKDLDESELAQLVAFVGSKGIADEHATLVVQQSLKVGISILNLVKAIQA